MSKVDAMRAIKDARRAAAVKAAGAPAPSPATARAARPAAAPATAAARPVTEPTVSEQACGHRSMNGRSCTRPSGHSEKNHRYG